MPASARLPVSTYWIPPSRRLSAMRANSTGTSSSSGGSASADSVARNYVDPWDLENYAYLRRHCSDLDDSDPVVSLSTNGLDSAHSDFYFVPARQPLTPLPPSQRSARRASVMEDAAVLVEEEDFYNARCEMRAPACSHHQRLRRASLAPAPAAIPAELQEKARPRQLVHAQGREPPPPPLVYVYQTPRPSRKMSTHIRECMPPVSTSGSGEDTDELYDELLSMTRRRRPHHHHHHHHHQHQHHQHHNHNHFGLNTFGHLKIDYSCNWSNLDRYIAHT